MLRFSNKHSRPCSRPDRSPRSSQPPLSPQRRPLRAARCSVTRLLSPAGVVGGARRAMSRLRRSKVVLRNDARCHGTETAAADRTQLRPQRTFLEAQPPSANRGCDTPTCPASLLWAVRLRRRLPARGVVLDPALEIREKLGNGEGYAEEHDQHRPEMLHQEVGRVELEQRAESDDGD